MALTAGQAKSVELYSGVESQVVDAYEGTSISANAWYAGDLIVFAADGAVDTVGATGAFSGIASDSCTGTDSTKFELFLIDPAAIYEMRVEDGKLSAIAYHGNKFGLNFTAGLQRIDPDETSAVDIYVVGTHPSDTGTALAGINEGRMLVRFNYDIFIGI